jgi:outer membrane protein
MKKLLFVGAMALSIFTATAQNKLGYINANELMGSMPETAKASAELEEYRQGLGQQYQDMTNEFNYKDSIFNTDSARLTPSMKEIKRKELIEIFQKVQGFEQASREQMQSKQEEKIAPIREKAITTIRTVAKENGFTYIFSEETLLVAPQGDNILPLVKAKLGIKDVPKTAPAKATPAKPGTGRR